MLIAHLDFKGVLPRPEYSLCLLQDISALGYDAVLVEYEDIFPFDSINIALNPNEKWSRPRLQEFLDEAARLNLEVVPLQQTLGHLEYVLRWNSYRSFALGDQYPSTIDITREAPRELALSMLREVLVTHPNSRYVHLGMDEAQALVAYSKENGRDVVAVFLDYLETLCDECEKFGVKPVIWSDMLEDHFSPTSLQRFQEFSKRVILCSWDYEANGQRTSWARFNGNRTARSWRENPLKQNDSAEKTPPISAAQLFVEDLDEPGKKFIVPHFDGETFAPLFWCDAWRDLGFEVWGASASRTSGNGAILPFYHQRVANVKTWSKARKRTGASAQVVTSWARGTTFCPPIFPFDATWFVLQEAARAEGRSTPEFFDGIEPETVTRIFQSLGKCREDWRIENEVANEMSFLSPQLKAHRLEWESVILLARVLHWSRQANFAHEEMTYFECNDLLPDSEWQRRLDEQAAIRVKGLDLKEQVSTHFAQLYEGDAFQEWVRDLFDVPLARMQNDTLNCRVKMENSLAKYAR